MQKIAPHLWFDKEAKEAAAFYTSLFPNSKVESVTVIPDTPSGDADVVSFVLAGQAFMAINAGPLFTFNPSVSFLISCAKTEEVDGLWEQLIEGGTALMPVDSYPFSERYGWLQDRYGLSWQIMYTGGDTGAQKITPMLMFVGDVCGKAEEAMSFYTKVFDDAKIDDVERWGADEQGEPEGNIKYATFTLEGVSFAAMESAGPHHFSFNEAVSFLVYCDTQDQIDYYWERLSAVPEAEQCGWLKDRYGLSWQIVPRAMDKMLQDSDPQSVARVTEAFLPMKKLDIATLEKAYAGG